MLSIVKQTTKIYRLKLSFTIGEIDYYKDSYPLKLIKKTKNVSQTVIALNDNSYSETQFNKLTSVFHACQSSCISADYFDNVMTKFIVNNKTNA